ncbi:MULTISPECIES: TIGR04255 family protein [unclassified Thioalkalivibrio]|uniref:TIGR04255 family protein n=1 Tax=unclassified Thioalkalivibrio TaxID=2621013 RepID=UPI0009D93C79|nr:MULTISPECIES: TIGR04255 family protein [unclassified Thioalkalivibrio]
MNLPVRLKHIPIFEATFEIRFVPDSDSSADLLPGMMLPDLKNYVTKLESLPASDLPKHLVSSDPSLQYQPLKRLVGDTYQIAIGPKLLAITVQRPYPGWDAFKRAIVDTLNSLKKTDQLQSAERCSLKYRNIIESQEAPDDLSKLNVDLKVANLNTSPSTQRIHCEHHVNGITNFISIFTKTRVQSSKTKEDLRGVLIDVDSIQKNNMGDFWERADNIIEELHSTEKEIFFSLLTSDTLQELGPE